MEFGGVRFVNDSKATNVEAARRAIESFRSGLVAIMGGRFKGGDLTALVKPLEERGATVIAIGEARSLLHEALGGSVTVRDAAVADRMNRAMGKRVALHYEEKVGLPTSCFGETRYFITRVTEVQDVQLGPGNTVPVPASPPAPSPGPAPPKN